MKRAFIGVSLDSRHFTDEWWHAAIESILRDHDMLTILIADDLLRYTRTVRRNGPHLLAEFERSDASIERRGVERVRHVNRVLTQLGDEVGERVSVFRYGEFCDKVYADLHRKLRIAFSCLDTFRTAVLSMASDYVNLHEPLQVVPGAEAGCCDFTLDEIAMCLRITEIEGNYFEFNPYDQLPILGELYAGSFAEEGLTVSALTGMDARRIYRVFAVEEQVS